MVVYTDSNNHVPAEQSYTGIMGNKFTSNSGKLFEYSFTRMGILAMALFYCCSVILLFMKTKSRFFHYFEYVGKMSLTNYLTHSFFYLLLFYDCGFGLLGKVHLYRIMPIGIMIFIVQAFLSMYWMQKFNYGPAEWIWRQLTYWKRLPIKKS